MRVHWLRISEIHLTLTIQTRPNTDFTKILLCNSQVPSNNSSNSGGGGSGGGSERLRVSQASQHARIIYSSSENDKPRSLNVIALCPNGSRFQRGKTACLHRTRAHGALLQRPAAIIHPLREVSHRVKERIDYRFMSILCSAISHPDSNERIVRDLDEHET